MAVNATSGFLSKQVYAAYNGRRLRGATDIQNVGANGVASVQPITTLESDNVEQITGITDPGQISMTFIADPTSSDYDLLVQEQKDSIEAEFRVVFGTGPEGAVTDGSGWTLGTIANADATAADVSGASTLTLTETASNALPALRVGHYVGVGTTPTYARITAIAVADVTGVVTITTSASTLATGGAAIQLVRPAFEFRRNCRILELSHSPQVDTPFGMSLTLLPTGNGTKSTGSPKLSI